MQSGASGTPQRSSLTDCQPEESSPRRRVDSAPEEACHGIELKSEPVSPAPDEALEPNEGAEGAPDARKRPERAAGQPEKTAKGETFCSFCQKSFSRAWSLQRHMADTHFYVPQSLTCELCGRSYKSRNSLVSHRSQYHARKERRDLDSQMEIGY